MEDVLRSVSGPPCPVLHAPASKSSPTCCLSGSGVCVSLAVPHLSLQSPNYHFDSLPRNTPGASHLTSPHHSLLCFFTLVPSHCLPHRPICFIS
ncbi:hypothetical protein E2C01_007580 [Portunus trituberculatus]|uniref:Uncharacterized protein n=1 Tax=Portunus trituberculatus TaxID=210409 RepID=A0A5B7D1J4_PORTR|nr:hypothetical protein [Portunus trituberculatus]